MSQGIETNNRFFAQSPYALLHSQLSAIGKIVRNVANISANLQRHGDHVHGPALADSAAPERPHQVYLIDGARGTGKTYTLLTLRHALGELHTLTESPSRPQKSEWATYLERDVIDHADLVKLRLAGSELPTRTWQVIFPGDMEGPEFLMENLIAGIMQDLENRARDTKSRLQTNPDPSGSRHDLLDTLNTLRKTLLEDVAQGWYFSRRLGVDAIIRDSSDYRELIGNFEKQARLSSSRIDKWKVFVDEYLKAINARSLTILIDDTDVSPELTENCLHAVRMFLSLPRIITVIAGNLKSMRNSLLHLSMRRIGPSVQSLNAPHHPTASDWRRNERQTIEEYLEKVLPPAKRFQVLNVWQRESSSRDANEKTDFEKVTGHRLPQFCQRAMLLSRKSFLGPKFRLAYRRERGQSDKPMPSDKSILEYFLSWWLFQNRYQDRLEPTSARQAATFRDFYREEFMLELDDEQASQKLPLFDKRRLRSIKRLPVALFDMSPNFVLIQRLNDEDHSFIDWLKRQELASNWSGRRTFTVNGREIYDKTFSYDFIRFRIDLGMATPIRDNPEEVIPFELLPLPLGRKITRRFFQPRQMPRRHRRLGVARWIDHSAIPDNCLIMRDLDAIPDDSLINAQKVREQLEQNLGVPSIADLQSGHWEAKLADDWYDLLDDKQQRESDEYHVRYFREIVCEALRGTENVSSSRLMAKIDPPEFMEKQSRAIYEHFIEDERAMFQMRSDAREMYWSFAIQRELARQSVKQLEDKVQARSIEKTSRQDLDVNSELRNYPRMIGLYSALVTDLRRAWHAIRIYEAQPENPNQDPAGRTGLDPGRNVDDTRPSLSVTATRDRMPIYTYDDIEKTLTRTEWVRDVLNVFRPDSIQPKLVEVLETEEARLIVNLFEPDPRAKELFDTLREALAALDDHRGGKGNPGPVSAALERLRNAVAAPVGQRGLRLKVNTAPNRPNAPGGTAADQEKENSDAAKKHAESAYIGVRELAVSNDLKDRVKLFAFWRASDQHFNDYVTKAGEYAVFWNGELRDDFDNRRKAGSRLVTRWRGLKEDTHLDEDSRQIVFGTASEKFALLGKLQVREEPEDFKRWTRALRAIGRIACDGWPIHDAVDNDIAPQHEVALFSDIESGSSGGIRRLRVIADSDVDTPSTTPSAARAAKLVSDQNDRNNARSARNFFLLLYGLAPSLPAVVHTNVMGYVYEAELLRKGSFDLEPGAFAAIKKEWFWRFPGARDGSQPHNVQEQALFMKAQSAMLYREAFQETEKWAKLIGSLSCTLRYIKMKCLQLDALLYIEFLTGSENGTDERAGELLGTEGHLKKIGYDFQTSINSENGPRRTYSEPELAKAFFDGLRILFSQGAPMQNPTKMKLGQARTGLAFFPDFAPSTLFGDDWFEDLLTRRGISKSALDITAAGFGTTADRDYIKTLLGGSASETAGKGPVYFKGENKRGRPEDKEDPLSVSGIFGETEQWLWAASRSVRKLREKLQKELEGIKDPESGKVRIKPAFSNDAIEVILRSSSDPKSVPSSIEDWAALVRKDEEPVRPHQRNAADKRKKQQKQPAKRSKARRGRS